MTNINKALYEVRCTGKITTGYARCINAEAAAMRFSREGAGEFEVWSIARQCRVTTYVDGRELPNYKR